MRTKVVWRAMISLLLLLLLLPSAAIAEQEPYLQDSQGPIGEVELSQEFAGKPVPSDRVMTELLWKEPAVERSERQRRGTLVSKLGAYDDDSRQSFRLAVWRMGPDFSTTVYYHINRSSGHWQPSVPFRDQGQALYSTLAAFEAHYLARAAYLPPMDPTLADQLYGLWLELDGRYADRVLVRPGRWSDQSVAQERSAVRTAVTAYKVMDPTNVGVIKLPYNQAVLTVWDRDNGPSIGTYSLWLFRNVGGRWFLTEWSDHAYPAVQSALLVSRLAVLPVRPSALPTGGTGQLLTLKELGRSEVGQLTTRFLRLAGLNNRHDLDGYCEGSLSGAVWNNQRWQELFVPISALDETQVLIEQDASGLVQVHCAAAITFVGSYRQTGLLTFHRVIRPAKVNAALPRTKAQRTVRTPVRADHSRIFPAKNEADRRALYGVPLPELPEPAQGAARKILAEFRRGDAGAVLQHFEDYQTMTPEGIRPFVNEHQEVLLRVDDRDIRVEYTPGEGTLAPYLGIRFPKSPVSYGWLGFYLSRGDGHWYLILGD